MPGGDMEQDEELSAAVQAAARLIDALGIAVPPGGSLTVVGTGIRAITQLTIESLAAMAGAEVLLHVIGDPTQEDAFAAINPAARDVDDVLRRGPRAHAHL